MDEIPKNISDMLVVVSGDIADRKLLQNREIDTVVNAAKPTLMGSNQGVDGVIHKTINSLLNAAESTGDTFADKICNELQTGREKNLIRCERGKSVMTSGYGFCEHILHVVGIPFDGKPVNGRMRCSSSRVRTIESCYEEIVNQIKSHTEIKVIAIPIIGAGEYGFPFKLAVRIALATVGNALVEWKRRDEEAFKLAGIRKIYFYIYDSDDSIMRQHFFYAERVRQRYLRIFAKDKKVVFQFSFRAHLQYMVEIWRYDNTRGYFSVARLFREFLMAVRILFLPTMFLKDLLGGKCWEKRRASVERIAFVKMLLPLCLCYIPCSEQMTFWFFWLVVYFMADTITYLLTLIVLADIQKPSANVIRSMIMLFINYLEVSFGLAFLYYTTYYGSVNLREAIAFGILGRSADIAVISVLDYTFLYVDAGTKFFFTSLVFGYLVNHMKQRQFRS